MPVGGFTQLTGRPPVLHVAPPNAKCHRQCPSRRERWAAPCATAKPQPAAGSDISAKPPVPASAITLSTTSTPGRPLRVASISPLEASANGAGNRGTPSTTAMDGEASHRDEEANGSAAENGSAADNGSAAAALTNGAPAEEGARMKQTSRALKRSESMPEPQAGRPDPRVAQVALEPGTVPVMDLKEAFGAGVPYRLALQDVGKNEGGPPRFISPYVPGQQLNSAALPLMLYLPGIDGTGLAASRQFPFLVRAFDLKALSVPGDDRTPFPRLVSCIGEYLEKEVGQFPPERPVYLLGESFGGVLALAVAAARPDLVDRVVLVNPATSFQRSPWPRLGPLLPRLPPELYSAVPVALAPVLGNPIALASFGIDPKAPLADRAIAVAEGLVALLPQLQALADILPAPTLAWKLQLLEEGNRAVEEVVRSVQQRVLVLVGDSDWLIPSADEGKRLEKLLPRATVKVFPGRSHALLQEAGMDLVKVLADEGFYVTRRCMTAPLAARGRGSFGLAAPIELPTRKELDVYSERAFTKLTRQLVSPVFLSRGDSGALQRGLGNIPPDRPLLFVGNHQTYALDLGLMVEQLLRERNILPRGLAHPAIFGNNDSDSAGGNGKAPDKDPPAFMNFMTTFGAVPVGGRNFFRLLQNGEAVLLFPGGVREAYKNRGEKYRLFWNERAEFVRMAARFGATIVPFAGVGCEDGINMLLGPDEIRHLPIIGEAIVRNVRNSIPQARRGVSENKELEDLFIQPLSVPQAPARFYYLFQQPIRTQRSDLDDPARVAALYSQVKGSVEAGIATLLRKRRSDPYEAFLPRIVYEASWGGKQAPTFPILPGD